MRIVIISAPSARKAPSDFVQSLTKGMKSMGHYVDILDAWTGDGCRLQAYEYIAVVTQPVSFFSWKIPSAVSAILGAASNLAGKKSAAFIRKGGLFTARSLLYLMRVMEKEGMMVNWSDVLLNPPHAEAMGKRVGA